jgi:hypothetical protein
VVAIAMFEVEQSANKERRSFNGSGFGMSHMTIEQSKSFEMSGSSNWRLAPIAKVNAGEAVTYFAGRHFASDVSEGRN